MPISLSSLSSTYISCAQKNVKYWITVYLWCLKNTTFNKSQLFINRNATCSKNRIIIIAIVSYSLYILMSLHINDKMEQRINKYMFTFFRILILSWGFWRDFSTKDALCIGKSAFVYRWRDTSEHSYSTKSKEKEKKTSDRYNWSKGIGCWRKNKNKV